MSDAPRDTRDPRAGLPDRSEDPDWNPTVQVCRLCGGAAYVCELPDSTCRFATLAREALGSVPAGVCKLLRSVEDGAWERLSRARTKQLETLTAERDRLRTALQPFARWAERIDAQDAECGHMPDEIAIDGSISRRGMPSMGDCRRAREALGR